MTSCFKHWTTLIQGNEEKRISKNLHFHSLYKLSKMGGPPGTYEAKLLVADILSSSDKSRTFSVARYPAMTEIFLCKLKPSFETHTQAKQNTKKHGTFVAMSLKKSLLTLY